MLIHIWLILIYWGMYCEQMSSLIKQEILSLNSTELSTMMPIFGTRKFNFGRHINVIKWSSYTFFVKGNSHKSFDQRSKDKIVYFRSQFILWIETPLRHDFLSCIFVHLRMTIKNAISIYILEISQYYNTFTLLLICYIVHVFILLLQSLHPHQQNFLMHDLCLL